MLVVGQTEKESNGHRQKEKKTDKDWKKHWDIFIEKYTQTEKKRQRTDVIDSMRLRLNTEK
jgi:hypothetical protein